ncbi:hypothetical protein AX16_007819 [Volvariella volvacea WC 439]|nr:hypothetical protein AX16_007819 [Volvariella volvacea WC 439]
MHLSKPLVLLPCVVSVASAALFSRQVDVEAPSCVLSCAASVDFGECMPDNIPCLCNSQAFANSYSTCVVGACTGDDITLGLGYFESACTAQGIDIDIGVTSSPPVGPTAGVDPNEPTGTDVSGSDPATPTDGGSQPSEPVDPDTPVSNDDENSNPAGPSDSSTSPPPSNSGTSGSGSSSSGSNELEDDTANAEEPDNGAVQAGGFVGLVVTLAIGVAGALVSL